MQMRRRRTKNPECSRPRQRGQAMTEFALTVPLLVALLVAIMAMAWMGFTLLSITSGARQGARHMATYYDRPSDPWQFPSADAEITYVITTSMPFLDWRKAEIILWPENVQDRVPGIQVSVEVRYPMSWPTIEIPWIVAEGSFTLLPPINLNAISSMRLD
jgi:hypothetical protein